MRGKVVIVLWPIHGRSLTDAAIGRPVACGHPCVRTAIGVLLPCHQIGRELRSRAGALAWRGAVLREEALARPRALFERDGKSLH